MKRDSTKHKKSRSLRFPRRQSLRHPETIASNESYTRPDISRIREIPPDPPELVISSDNIGPAIMQTLLADPFPRQHDLEIFIDEDGFLQATVPHHAKYYVPDAIGPSACRQYQAGPGAAGHPGLYELSLSVMFCYLPAGFDNRQPLIMDTGRPRPQPVPVSRAAWELHRDFAEDILLQVEPARTKISPQVIYEWICEKRPDLQDLIFTEPTSDPLDV